MAPFVVGQSSFIASLLDASLSEGKPSNRKGTYERTVENSLAAPRPAVLERRNVWSSSLIRDVERKKTAILQERNP